MGAKSSLAAGHGAMQQAALSKVVLARRSNVVFCGDLDPLALLEALQERDPRAYQVGPAALAHCLLQRSCSIERVTILIPSTIADS